MKMILSIEKSTKLKTSAQMRSFHLTVAITIIDNFINIKVLFTPIDEKYIYERNIFPDEHQFLYIYNC